MSKLKLQATDGSAGTVSLKAPASTTGNAEFELTLPGNAGSNGQLLSTNGSGVLTWTDDANAPEGTVVKSTGVTGTTKYLRADGDNTCSWQTVTSVGGATGVDFNDNVKARWGTGNDLEIYHSGTHSFIKDAGTGNLQTWTNQLSLLDSGGTESMIQALENGAVELYYDNSKKFETTSYGSAHTGIMRFENSGDGISLYDSRELKFGNGDDLKIYHDGSNSYLDESGTGNLHISTTAGYIQIQKNTGEQMVKASVDGAVELYYDGNKKLETDTYGIYVYGPEGGDGNIYLYADEGDDNADKWRLRSATDGSFYIQNINNGTVWDTNIKGVGEGTTELYFDSTKKFETTSAGATVSGQLTVDGNLISYSANNNSLGLTGHRWNDLFIANDIDLLDNSILMLGTGNDLNLWHDGSNSNIENQTGQLRIRGSYIFLRSEDAQETFAQFTVNAASELFYDNSKKCETTNSGLRVYGNLDLEDDEHIRIGNSDDLDIYHSSGVNYIMGGSANIDIRAVDGEHSFIAKAHNAVELYYDGSKKFETFSAGFRLCNNSAITMNSDSSSIYFGASDDMRIMWDGSAGWINNQTSGHFQIRHAGNTKWQFQSDGALWGKGNISPWTNNTYDLGESSYRWRNIYTNDLHLSNEGGDGNSVDGTTGDWTIQEGADDLFIVNNKNGKKFKIALQEVS